MGCSNPPPRKCTTVVVVVVVVVHPGDKTPPPPPKPLKPLELQKCTINAYITDIHSFVTLSQKFHNPNNTAASGIYNFSVLASAAICGFKVIRGSGTELHGKVKSSEDAQKEYDAAVKAGKTAALGKEITKDIFSICVGNLAPNETLTVELSYINTLIDQGAVSADQKPIPQLNFTLPRAYVQRYGTSPSGDIDKNVKTDIPYDFTLNIQQLDDIINIRTPKGVITPPKGTKTATVTLSSNDTTLRPNKDIEIIITAKGLEESRAFIEPYPNEIRPTTAIALSWMPDLDSTVYALEPPPEMEYLILLDRSKSMEGAKLDAVKDTLRVLLRKLTSQSLFYPYDPFPDAYFNIFSYGQTTKALWNSSKKAVSGNIRDALSAIDEMKADMGNKDILQVLKVVFAALTNKESQSRPVSIFLMTDGVVFNVHDCMRYIRDQIIVRQETIKKALGPCPPAVETFLRVFTIGLGNGVSTELCDGVARAGGGYSTYISQYTNEADVLGRIQRLVAGSQMPPVNSNFKFTWDPTENPPRSDPNAWENRQAPQVLPNIFPYTRSNAYQITGTKGESGTIEVFSSVPSRSYVPRKTFKIHSARLPTPKAPFIHVCAAKAIITDYEDALYLARFPDDEKEIKKEIIRVGIDYQMTSRYTSFVVVDDGTTVGASQEVFNYIPPPIIRLPDGGPGPVIIDQSTAPLKSQASDGILNPDVSSILLQLVQLQQSDGSFGESSKKVIDLITQGLPPTALSSLTDRGYGDEIVAMLLAHSWISIKCPDEGSATKIRADQWLEINAETVDIGAIHSSLSKVITA